MEGCRGGEEKGHEADLPVDIERHASYLADAFDDRRSLAWYRLVLRVVPREIVWDAFTRARDVPRTRLRRSRAALFTALVREYVDGTRRPRRRRGRPAAPSPCLSRP